MQNCDNSCILAADDYFVPTMIVVLGLGVDIPHIHHIFHYSINPLLLVQALHTDRQQSGSGTPRFLEPDRDRPKFAWIGKWIGPKAQENFMDR